MLRAEVEEWLSKATDDLKVARFLRSNPSLAGSFAAFHFQQAAEKAMKGLLVANGVEPPHSHDLRAILVLLGWEGSLDLDVADELTPFAVLARYPGFGSEPDGTLLDRFDRFVESCVSLLGEKLPDGTAGEGGPGA